jgi:hypothetical protein
MSSVFTFALKNHGASSACCCFTPLDLPCLRHLRWREACSFLELASIAALAFPMLFWWVSSPALGSNKVEEVVGLGYPWLCGRLRKRQVVSLRFSATSVGS